MIKRLRRKFIFTAMLSVILVLVILMATINISNFAKNASYADNLLDILYQNDGGFPDNNNGGDVPTDTPKNTESDTGTTESETGTNSGTNVSNAPVTPDGTTKNDSENPNPPKDMNAETPYETRFFTVKYTDGNAVANIKSVASITSSQAIELADKVVKKGSKRGYVGVYRYLLADGNTFVLFVDCSRLQETAKNFLKYSLIFSSVGLVAVAIMVVIFSHKAVKPIAESYEKQKRFITDASHELKTPLTIISANNEITEMATGETKSTKCISAQVERMTAMIKNLTALARLDEKDDIEKKVAFSATDDLTDITESFRPIIENAGKTLSVDAEEVFIKGDEGLFRQAISVVCENACKYSLTMVDIKMKKIGKNAVITIQNDADHIENGNLDKCFERFYRTDEARASTVYGSGIGLSIAKAVVVKHGGTISATGLDGFFMITITLPIA